MEYYMLKYLEDKSVVSRTATGEPLCTVRYRPDIQDTMTTIYSESAPQRTDMHHYDSDAVGIQFLTRGEDRSAVDALAWEIHRKLTGLGSLLIDDATDGDGETLDEITVVDTHIVNPPTFLENDSKNRLVLTHHYVWVVQIGGNLYRKLQTTQTP